MSESFLTIEQTPSATSVFVGLQKKFRRQIGCSELQEMFTIFERKWNGKK